MSRLYLIDPWLADAKGHNYQYALDVAGAAEQRGLEPILAIRQSPSSDLRFSAGWRVEKTFTHGECPRHWLSLDGRSRYPYDLEGNWLPDVQVPSWRRWLDWPVSWDRRRRLASFVRGCNQLFLRVPPQPDDILFFPSLSEFDFVAAVRFWRDHAWTRRFDWHLQFHFNFFAGRDPEFVGQAEMLQRFQQLFRAAVDQVPGHRLHFYATTEAIARQYDRLGIAIFHPLPYPVRPLQRIGAEPPSVLERPLRVTLPGAMRREKGKKQIGPLIEATWDEFLRPGRVQYVFQTSAAAITRWLPRRLLQIAQVATDTGQPHSAPLLAAPHPLDTKRYTDLICRSDIGLFVYDSRRYFPRASGVLCEMLSAGIPVIVPAGCWLADQIAEENYRYVDQLWRHHAATSGALEWSADESRELSLSTAADTFLLRFAWPAGAQPGAYVELIARAEGRGAADSEGMEQREVLGGRDGGIVGVVVQFPHPVQRLRVALRPAYSGAAAPMSSFQILPVPPRGDGERIPGGSIGLVAASEREVPRLLRELCTHYGHYAQAARRFAQQWQAMHSPMHTVLQLQSRSTAAGCWQAPAA